MAAVPTRTSTVEVAVTPPPPVTVRVKVMRLVGRRRGEGRAGGGRALPVHHTSRSCPPVPAVQAQEYVTFLPQRIVEAVLHALDLEGHAAARGDIESRPPGRPSRSARSRALPGLRVSDRPPARRLVSFSKIRGGSDERSLTVQLERRQPACQAGRTAPPAGASGRRPPQCRCCSGPNSVSAVSGSNTPAGMSRNRLLSEQERRNARQPGKVARLEAGQAVAVQARWTTTRAG